jgi:hypothetical protein
MIAVRPPPPLYSRTHIPAPSREQLLFRGTNTTGTAMWASGLSGTSVLVVSQPAFTTLSRGASAFRGTVFGECVSLEAFWKSGPQAVCCVLPPSPLFAYPYPVGGPIPIGFALNSAPAGGTVSVATSGVVTGFSANIDNGAWWLRLLFQQCRTPFAPTFSAPPPPPLIPHAFHVQAHRTMPGTTVACPQLLTKTTECRPWWWDAVSALGAY